VLGTLPWLEREALRLVEWEQLDMGEAAQVAGCSSATFRVRLHRARRHLAARLVDPEPRLARTTANEMVGRTHRNEHFDRDRAAAPSRS
jgi:predicted DNA-binding protein (UPF0251 family)